MRLMPSELEPEFREPAASRFLKMKEGKCQFRHAAIREFYDDGKESSLMYLLLLFMDCFLVLFQVPIHGCGVSTVLADIFLDLQMNNFLVRT